MIDKFDYIVRIEEDQDGGFVAYIPELKGCITQGETLEEALMMIEDAKRLWIESAIEHGDFEI